MRNTQLRGAQYLYHSILILFGFLTFGMSRAQNSSTLEKVAVYPSLIIYNGKIASMDSKMTFYQAMAVRDDRIWKMGTNADIKPLAGPPTEMVDVKGHTVVPGLIDAHTHPHLWALPHLGGKYDPQLAPVYVEGKDMQEVKSRLREALQNRIRQAGTDKWIIASIPWQLAYQLSTKDGISRADLDAIAPNTPVFMASGYFSGVSNSKAVDIMDKKLGKEMVGLRAWYMVPYDIILPDKLNTIADMLVEEMKENVTYGITTFATHIEPISVYRALNMLHLQGKMPARWAWVHRTGFTLAKDPVEFYRLLGDFTGQGDNWLWNFGVGQESWGGSCTAAIPKTDEVRRRLQGCTYTIGNVGYEAHKAAVESGLRLAIVHAINDGELDGAIRLADQVIKEGSLTLDQVRNPGWSFDHGHLVRPDQIPLAARYGFWMSFQATQAVSSIETVPQDFGDQYISWITPINSWIKAGARFILSSDSHIGKLDPEADKMIDQSLIRGWPYHDSIWPWVGWWVTREYQGKVWSPDERIDRITALRGWTIYAAEDLLRGKELGSLEPGKLADFAVIDKDYFTIPDKDLVTINNLMTGLNGKVVYKSPNF